MHSTADYTVTTSIEKSAFLSASLIHWLMVTTNKTLRPLPVGWQNYIFNINAKKCKYMVLSRKGWALNLMKSYSLNSERESEAEFKYLGIHISANPSWSSQFSTNLQEGKEVDRNALQKILCQCWHSNLHTVTCLIHLTPSWIYA